MLATPMREVTFTIIHVEEASACHATVNADNTRAHHCRSIQ